MLFRQYVHSTQFLILSASSNWKRKRAATKKKFFPCSWACTDCFCYSSHWNGKCFRKNWQKRLKNLVEKKNAEKQCSNYEIKNMSVFYFHVFRFLHSKCNILANKTLFLMLLPRYSWFTINNDNNDNNLNSFL